MSNFLKMTDAGKTWLVRIVFEGEGYGLWDDGDHEFALRHIKRTPTGNVADPLVEFFDMSYAVAPFEAQHVSRYYSKSLIERLGGLNLDGGIPARAISPEGMAVVRLWLNQFSTEDMLMSFDNPHRYCCATIAADDDGTGNPGLSIQKFFVPESSYNLGEHINVARRMAKQAGMEGEMVTFLNEELRAQEVGLLQLYNTIGLSQKPDEREASVILAALRWFQSCKNGEHDMSGLTDIIDSDDVSMTEIDDLCEKVNFG